MLARGVHWAYQQEIRRCNQNRKGNQNYQDRIELVKVQISPLEQFAYCRKTNNWENFNNLIYDAYIKFTLLI